MRTAEEILEEEYHKLDIGGGSLDEYVGTGVVNALKKAMKQYAKEALLEAMNRVQIICNKADYNGGNLNAEFSIDKDVFTILIQELK